MVTSIHCAVRGNVCGVQLTHSEQPMKSAMWTSHPGVKAEEMHGQEQTRGRSRSYVLQVAVRPRHFRDGENLSSSVCKHFSTLEPFLQRKSYAENQDMKVTSRELRVAKQGHRSQSPVQPPPILSRFTT